MILVVEPVGQNQNDKARVELWGSRLARSALIAAIIVAAFVVLRERQEDIDINSGRLRSQARVGPIVISESVRNTPLSQLVNGSNSSPEWRHVNTEGVLDEHGRYGLAASELERFIIVCDSAQVDHQKRVAYGRRLLELLRGEDFEQAEKLIDEISNAHQP